jgi:hypothetical protein
MTRIIALALLLMPLTAGCHAQVPPNPVTYSCPPSTGTAYAPLNQASPTAALTYSWTPVSGVYCVIVQSTLGTAVSVPSNTAGPVAAAGDTFTASWTPPSTGPTPSGYVVSMAPAVQTTLGAPTLAPAIAGMEPPGARPSKELSKLAAPTGTAVKTGL